MRKEENTNIKNNRNRKQIIFITILAILLITFPIAFEVINKSIKNTPDATQEKNSIPVKEFPIETTKPYEIETGDYIDNKNSNDKPEVGHIIIPVIPGEITVSSENPYITFANPDANKDQYYLVFRIFDESSKELVYESGLVRPGTEYKFSVNMMDLFSKGTHKVRFEIQGYSIENQTPLNGNSCISTLYVK